MRKKIAQILRWQAKRYLNKNNPKVVVISGSVGKTSTTQAIATVLSEKFRVRKTIANYNTDLGVPCSIFGRMFPSVLQNVFAWFWIMLKNEFNLLSKSKIEILVLEIGTDNPGEIALFAWLKPDIAVVTAVTPEHMEQFQTIDAVAKEELSVSEFSEKTIINKDMVDGKFLAVTSSLELYNYSRNDLANVGLSKSDLQVVGDHSIDAVSAALAVGRTLGMTIEELASGAKKVRAQNGRMNVLRGISNSTLIDDTYNSSPDALSAALVYLQGTEAKQRIALIGNMNELGTTSEVEHRKIGDMCDPEKLNLVVTLGPDANNFTYENAKAQGCTVVRANNPYEAAANIKKHVQDGALILVKGSQNDVFAEEAVKILLENPKDEKHLVRQSSFWAKKKMANFGKIDL